MLAKGSDGNLKALAKKDLTDPTEPFEQAAVGDAWWDAVANVEQDKHAKQLRALTTGIVRQGPS